MCGRFGVRGDYIADGCDPNDGANDGTVTLFDLPTGQYLIAQSQAPDGYIGADDVETSFTAGQSSFVTVVNHLGATLIVIKTDEQGEPITDDNLGACFNLHLDTGNGTPGDYVAFRCDRNDGSDGRMTFDGLDTGSYVLVEWRAPEGYLAGPNPTIDLVAGESVELPVTNERGSTVTMIVTDENNNPLTDDYRGACFAISHDAGNGTAGEFVDSACDWDDFNNGRLTLVGLSPGDYVINQFRAPDGYLPTADRQTAVEANQDLEITVTNERAGILEIRAVTEANDELQDTCYSLYTDDGTGQRGQLVASFVCDWDDGSDGITHIGGLASGDYILDQDFAPDGYVGVTGQTVEGVVAGQTTVVTVVNTAAQ